MSKWSDKYKRSIDCSNPKGFSQKAHCAGRKKRSLKEAGRPYSAKYMKALIKAGQGKTADTVNVKIPKSGHFIDEEELDEVLSTAGRVAGQYLGSKIGLDAPGASAGEALGVMADYHAQKAARTAKARFKKFKRGVARKGYKPGDLTRAALNKPRKPEPVRKEPTLKKENGPCWDTHKQIGMKMKKGRRVPNCVPKNEDAPTVSAGSGQVAGIGVGPDGEPGVNLKLPKKRKKELEKMTAKKLTPTFLSKEGHCAGIGPQGENGMPKKRGRKFRKLMPFIMYMKRNNV
jgi:hypothetical protein|tara:strand:- start:2265 stop:3128 length:864 start_codon:yes stop_codon:yes gene_type:complete